MQKINETDYEVIEIGDISILHFFSVPERIEAKVVFNRDDISQKLIFKLMDICHRYGVGIASPIFSGPDDAAMMFIIGTDVPNKRLLKRYVEKLCWCLEDVNEFSLEFDKQLDFSIIDLTMFADMESYEMHPEQVAAIRDQHFNGSWEKFKKVLLADGLREEAQMINRYKKFEKANKKDIGFVGHKLGYLMEMLDPMLDYKSEKN